MSCRDPALVKRIGEATALEVRATGIQYAFAPCIAVRIDNTSFMVDTSVWTATLPSCCF
jgi:beta-glucosidase-like glycosyl hydrolase